MNSFYEKLLANADAAFDVKYSAAGPVGVARAAPRTKSQVFQNVIDNSLPTIEGYVLDVSPSRSEKVKDINFTVAVTNVGFKPDSPHVLKLPNTGAVVQLSTSRWSNPTNEKCSIPHFFGKVPHFVELDGIISLSVKPAKNGPLGSELKLNSYPIGTKLELGNVIFETKRPKDFWACYGSAATISLVKEAPPVHERVGKTIENALNESQGLQRQMAHSYARLSVETIASMTADVQADAIVLADAYENKLVEFAEKAIVAGEKDPVNLPLVEDGGDEAIRAAVGKLRSFVGENLLDLHDLFDPDGLCWTGFSGARKLMAPIVQRGVPPQIDQACMRRAETGFGAQTFGVTQFPDDNTYPAGTKLLAEMVLAPAPEKVAAEKTKNIGAFAIDCVATNIVTKDADGEWVPIRPKLQNGTSLATKQFLLSAKAGKTADIKNLLGVYDFKRNPEVFHTLVPYMSTIFMPNKLAPSAAPYPDVQPQQEADWGFGFRHLFDFAGAIQTVGIAVSEAWIDSYVLDDDDETAQTLAEWQQYAEQGADGKPLHPQQPKLGTHGYVCLNGVPDTNVKKLFKKVQLPTGTTLKCFAVFAGCDKVKDHYKANTNPEIGEQAIKSHFKTFDDDGLIDVVKKEVAVYAVVVANPKRKRDDEAASSSDTENKDGGNGDDGDEPEAKKSK